MWPGSGAECYAVSLRIERCDEPGSAAGATAPVEVGVKRGSETRANAALVESQAADQMDKSHHPGIVDEVLLARACDQSLSFIPQPLLTLLTWLQTTDLTAYHRPPCQLHLTPYLARGQPILDITRCPK